VSAAAWSSAGLVGAAGVRHRRCQARWV